MLLVYVPRLTNRLGYTLNVVFHNFLRIPYQITTDADHYRQYEDEKIAYGESRLPDGVFFRAARLLFETSVVPQELRHSKMGDTHTIFSVENDGALPFDPFAAIFFMLTRYEEYLPHPTDLHGRFPASQSAAFQLGFLQQAVVDRWALMIRDAILQTYPEASFAARHTDFLITVDVDAAYCYRHKGLLRTTRGFLLDTLVRHDIAAAKKRLLVILNKEKDPYDTFDYMLSVLQNQPPTHSIFFILLGDYSAYDKPIPYTNRYFKLLIQQLGDSARVGIHPSYYSLEHPNYIAKETQRLANILHRNIAHSRAHFLRVSFPQTYHDLMDAGIKHDYSLGFPDEPGFRCGTCTPYPLFDLSTNQEQPLTIHPFVIMDTTLNGYKHYSVEQAQETYQMIIDETRHNKGTMTTLWHNQNLCETFGWQGWRKLFEFVATAGDNR